MLEELEEKYTKYEVARILGARSLQLAMDAPVLLKMTKEQEEDLNYDTLRIAEKELIAGVLPISVKRPLPKKSEKTVKKLSEKEIAEKQAKKAEDVEEIEEGKKGLEEEDEENIKEEGEIMEMATPEDEEIEENKPEGIDEIQ